MDVFSLGSDISKGYADFLILDAQGCIREPTFQLDDTFDGHHRLYVILKDFLEAHPGATLRAAVESTGGYENNWFEALRRFQASLPIKVARLNPAPVAEHTKALGTRVVTDAVSAYAVATYQLKYPEKIRYDEDDALASLRALWGFVDQLKKQRTALKNQLESVLYRAHPELVSRLTGKTPQWLLTLLLRYPTAQRLARARAKAVAKIPYVTPERAKALIEAARRSAASASDEVTEHLVRSLVKQVGHLTALIDEELARISDELARDERLSRQAVILKSFGHIGDQTAAGLLLEIQSVERFASAKRMASFFGLHPVYKKSGDGLSGVRMSKQGSPRMRALLYHIVLGALQKHETIHPLYRRLVDDEKMNPSAAIGQCMHKVLRMLYGMLRHDRLYDGAIERAHRRRSADAAQRPQRDVRRRYQHYDSAAPISDRARKRRRPQPGSQDAEGTVCGMSPAEAVVVEQRRE